MQKAILLFSIFFIAPLFVFTQSQNQIDAQGQKQGRWVKAYNNGKVRYIGQFRDDRPYGEFNYYYESGALQTITNFSDDGIIAQTKTFHENGTPMATGNYIRQKKEGLWRYYSDIDSSLIAEENYQKGVLHGKSVNYYPETGKAAESFEYFNGKKEGPYLKFFPDGSTMTDGTYKNDQLDGEFTLFYPDGKIQLKGQYKDGQQTGNWNYFDEEGNAIQEEDFKNDIGD
ncbi:MAG: hypothetical protein DRI89_14685 [Bacteroidetes bacterium]|nr:MAG: hypothetical protein DRI89_14685 [Bacteroidota bacterium]